MQSGPYFRKDLAIVFAVSTVNSWLSVVCGLTRSIDQAMWNPSPLILTTIAWGSVLEGIRRCGEPGATVACVGADMPFYLSIGFKELFTLNCWIRYF